MLVRPMFDSDLRSLYLLAGLRGSAWHRVCAEALPSPDQFLAVYNYDSTFNAIVESEGGQLVGAGSLYGADVNASHVRLDAITISEPEFGHYRSRLVTELVNHAFVNWPFRSVVAIYHDFEPPPFDGQLFPWQEDGRLRDAYRHNGQLYDRIFTRVLRSDWE